MASGGKIMHPNNDLVLINLVPSIMVTPGTASYMSIGENKNSQQLLKLVKEGKAPYVFTVMAKPGVKEAPDKFYTVGVVAETKEVTTRTRSIVNLKGLFRANILNFKKLGEDWILWQVSVGRMKEDKCDDVFVSEPKAILADMMRIRDLMVSFVASASGVYEFDDDYINFLVKYFDENDWKDRDTVDAFIWKVICAVPDLTQEDKQPIIESPNLLERVRLCIKVVRERIELLEIQKEKMLAENTVVAKKRSAKNTKPTVTPLDKTSIATKVEDEDSFVEKAHPDIIKRWVKFKQVRDYMSEDARQVVLEDIGRLKSFETPQGNTHEWPKFMGRLDFILGLPWKDETVQESNISKVEEVLEEDHYGLKRVKDRISESIAPKILNPESKGHIICLVGPPGVGKTSLAKSIARALGRKYIRMSLGGVRDEAQIRGHKITYIGSEAGEVLKLIRRCGSKNPVFVIDEIDKLGGMSVSGDPSSAMLEVFDPEQNNSFKDHYASCGFDLSKVMFIATANVESNIMPPLRDRMDVITIPGYLEVEKLEIAKKYLIPRWTKEVGLSQNNIVVHWSDDVISNIIRGYTREAGVRNLERAIASILRKIARAFLKSQSENTPILVFYVTDAKVSEYLGHPRFLQDRVRSTKIGEAIGLAWTPVGGDVLYVQAEFYDRVEGKKVLDLTGMQGVVMKESDKLALTRLRGVLRDTRPELADELIGKSIHLHIPEGAVPKDGPSAGVTILSALYSEVVGVVVKPNLAMTGEIDNKGRVLAVGGIREKIVAAESAGIREIIMPKSNERDLEDVPRSVRDKLKFNFVETTDEVLEIAFPKVSEDGVFIPHLL